MVFRVVLPVVAGAALLAVGTVPAAAAAEEAASAGAPAPTPTVGDTWTHRRVDLYNRPRDHALVAAFVRREGDPLRFEMAGRDGRVTSASRTADLRSCNRAKDIAEPKCASVYRFPLAVGGKSDYSRLPSDGGYRLQRPGLRRRDARAR